MTLNFNTENDTEEPSTTRLQSGLMYNDDMLVENLNTTKYIVNDFVCTATITLSYQLLVYDL